MTMLRSAGEAADRPGVAGCAAPLDQPFFNVPDAMEVHGRTQREKAAIICGDVTRTWGDLTASINRVAHALGELNIRKGDKVAVLMGQTIETLEVMFGIVRAGACAVPLAAMLTGEQLADLINDSDSVLLFATDDYIVTLHPHLGKLRRIGLERCYSVRSGRTDWQSYETLTSGRPSTPPGIVHAAEDDFMLVYSSGTTGLPKGIVGSHRARSHVALSHAIELGVTSSSRVLTTTALASNGTWTIMLPALFVGATVSILPRFDVDLLLDVVRRDAITHTFMVPTQLAMMLENEAVTATALGSLRSVLVGGSVLRQNLRQRFLDRVGNIITELYGCSEGFATFLTPDRSLDKAGTVGRPAIGYEGRVISEDGKVAAPGERGEIVGYGPGMLTAYYGRPEATEALIWRDARGRSFIRTGDIGIMDQDGFISIVDRKKDMIISGGYNVYPVDIEAVIAQHPAVRDVAVIGAPHDKWGETPVAVIICKVGAQIAKEGLSAWANERLAKHQRLSDVLLVEEFPRNALGKVMKRALRVNLGLLEPLNVLHKTK